MDLFENVYALTFGLWPAAVILCALLNMLITFKFSWSELIIDYLIGMVIGVCHYYGMVGNDISGWEHFFLMVSTGLFGLLEWTGTIEMTSANFFWLCVGCQAGCILLTGALDYGAGAIGYSSNAQKGGNIALSFLIILFKFPWALVTTGVGLIIGIIGLIYRATHTSPHGDGVGFVGGTLWFEWGGPPYHATTFGCVVNAFRGSVSDTFRHELVHSRQYIYMHDWLGVFFFTLAGIWGVISSAIGDTSFIGTRYWDAHNTDEIGNPIEIVPTHKYP
jgi:hypothetical protein